MTISFATDNGAKLLNVLPPAGEAIFVGSSAETPTGSRRAARRWRLCGSGLSDAQCRAPNEVANYTITIGNGAATGATPPEGDFADSLSGGPDFWVVTGGRQRRAQYPVRRIRSRMPS